MNGCQNLNSRRASRGDYEKVVIRGDSEELDNLLWDLVVALA